MEPWILHIETSTKTTSIALSQGDRIAALAEDVAGDHTRVINDLIRQVLSEAGLRLDQLQAISVNEGPGSYTALRIGVVSAKGMAYALDLPLILVPGLRALAQLARTEKPGYHYYLPMLDARRDEVYLGV
ncbi:MAG TPA: tRNA (adenosine(37)-N6)-threonylcarbamoyltransferase complex dimerization subunit type 1 TsaB, partial [Saprospiraceae bacterium]|nr:tRNA (adenosine(37)-N6)-threonylcarbamoyltransferase complex dimerization subunit type 1 TsaB [Saprospiraceae bacterium]